jgi:hypothetical protein
MDGVPEYLCIHSMMYLATRFAADAGLVTVPWEHCRLPLAKSCSGFSCCPSYPNGSELCVPDLFAVCCRAENSELGRCYATRKGKHRGGCHVGCRQQRVSRTLGDGVRIAYHHLHAYDNSINLICSCRQQCSRIWYPHNRSPT